MLSLILGEGLAVTLLGSLLHFTYEWSGRKKWVGIFSATNESTWEHIKLALSGLFACTLVDVWFLGGNPHYWLARGASFLVPVVAIPVIFYTYQRWTHHPVLWVDIMTFAVAAFLSAAVFAGVLTLSELGAGWNYFGMGFSVAILAAYLLLTRFPLHNFLFRDPNTHRYGFDGRRRPQRKRRS